MTRSALALALLATFVVQGAALPVIHAQTASVSRLEEARKPVAALPLPAAALPSTGAPVSVPAYEGAVGTAIMAGNISWADPELGGDYLATRFPRGTLVEICGSDTGICIVRRTNDFGPHAGIRPNRIADLAVLDWEQICRLDRERGLCPGTVEAIEDFTLPATDTR